MKHLLTKIAFRILWSRVKQFDHVAGLQIAGLPDDGRFDGAAEMIERASVGLQSRLRYVETALSIKAQG